MGMTNYPNGFPYGVTIRGVPILNLYTGKTFWVDSVHGQTGNSGTFGKPLATINGAIAKCTANHGDIVICKAGHIETVSAATSCVLSKAGICVIFLGQGAKKATLNITAAAAYVRVTAANCALISPRFLSGIDAIAKGLSVEAADFFLGGGVEYYDAPAMASTIQVLTTSAALRFVVDGYRYFVSTTGTQKTDGIKTAGDLAGAVLKNIDIRGDFTGGYPVNISAAITNLQLENIYLNNLNSGPVAALGVHANTTGFAKNVKTRVASGTTYISSVAKLSWANDCEGFSTDGYTGDPLGTVLSTGIEGKIDVIDGYFDVPVANAAGNTTIRDVVGIKTDTAVNVVAADKSLVAYVKGVLNEITVPGADNTENVFMNDVIGQKTDAAAAGTVTTTDTVVGYVKQLVTAAVADALLSASRKKVIADDLVAANITGTATRFTITGGLIRVLSLGVWVSTAIPAGANTLQFGYTPAGGGGANTLSGATDTASAAADQLFLLDGTKATGPIKTTDVGVLAAGQLLTSTPIQGVILAPGIITTIFSAGPPATGAITVFMEYEPMTASAAVA